MSEKETIVFSIIRNKKWPIFPYWLSAATVIIKLIPSFFNLIYHSLKIVDKFSIELSYVLKWADYLEEK